MLYPSILPIPVRDGYTSAPSIKKRRIKMDDGSARTRRLFNTLPYLTSLTFRYTPEQLSIFDAFIKYDCKYGTEWFDLIIRADQPAVNVKLIGDAPSVKPMGYDWEVTFTVMTRTSLTVGTGSPANLATLTAWPSDLPLPDKDSYSYQISNFNIEDNLDQGGMPNSRSRFTVKEVIFQATWLFTKAERDRFYLFFRDGLLDGHLPVVIPFYNGLGLTPVKSTFVEHPNENQHDAIFQVSAKMATLYMPVMSEQAYRLKVAASA